MTWESLTQDLAELNRVIDESPILAFRTGGAFRPSRPSVLAASFGRASHVSGAFGCPCQ